MTDKLTISKAVRDWQRDCGYMKPAREVGNQIFPCISKDGSSRMGGFHKKNVCFLRFNKGFFT